MGCANLRANWTCSGWQPARQWRDKDEPRTIGILVRWERLANAGQLTPYRPADTVAVVERRFEFAFPSKRRRSLMRARMGIGVISLLIVQTVYAADVPITSNPIPE